MQLQEQRDHGEDEDDEEGDEDGSSFFEGSFVGVGGFSLEDLLGRSSPGLDGFDGSEELPGSPF